MKASTFTLSLAAILMASGISAAQNKVPTPEQRKEMAKHFETMAACLRSKKPIEECRKEMMQSCESKMGEGGCMMMGEMGGMRGHGMKYHEDSDEKKSGK